MQADKAKALVAEMRASGLEPDIYTYGPLVAALGRAGLVDEAFQVRRPLPSGRGRPTPPCVVHTHSTWHRGRLALVSLPAAARSVFLLQGVFL